ncbi:MULTISPECIES: hypothetical protein [Pyrobaculum]|uniref:hypothetical protein n=1 Tax=Pyrobaculum TaxID=2276 RepID=UPI0023EFBA44|nr:hypothetical protein [Pyrobaculum aerophilum]
MRVRFACPEGPNTDMEPPPLKTPTFPFRDVKTGLESVDIEELKESAECARSDPPNPSALRKMRAASRPAEGLGR